LNPNNPDSINQLPSDDIIITADRVYKPLTQRKITSIPVSTETIDPYYFKNNPLYAHLYDPDFEGDPEMPDVVMNN
jgi:hypothetical protein